jgi:multidrug transporter EmrE-like cation transporter
MPLEVPPIEASPLAAPASKIHGFAVLAVLIVSVGFATAGQLTLKKAMERIGPIGTAQVNDASDTILRMIKEPLLWTGLFLFGISALFWLVVLSQIDLSLAYPVVGLSYVLIVGFSKLVLHEHVPTTRWIGVIVVAAGIAVIGWSFRGAAGS